jgi:hypothetical protein
MRLMPVLMARLQTLPRHDPWVTLKALVDERNQGQQQACFAQRQTNVKAEPLFTVDSGSTGKAGATLPLHVGQKQDTPSGWGISLTEL